MTAAITSGNSTLNFMVTGAGQTATIEFTCKNMTAAQKQEALATAKINASLDAG
jgi:hypothetical protein